MTDRELLEEIFTKITAIEVKIDENTQVLKEIDNKSEINKEAYMEEFLKSIDESINTVKEILERHEVDMEGLKK